MKNLRNAVCLVLVIITMLAGISLAEKELSVPKIFINDVPIVFLNQDNSVMIPTVIDGEVYVPLTSLLDMLQMPYVEDENSIKISTSGIIAENALPASSGIKLDDFQAMVKADTTFEECKFTQIESEEGNAYAYPVDKDYGITIYMDEQEMITRVIYNTTFDYEGNVPYLDSMNDYEFFTAMADMRNVPMIDFPVFTFVNNSASLLMYITGNSEDNPYSKVFDSNGEIVAENNWEYTLTTNKEAQTAKFEFNYIAE